MSSKHENISGTSKPTFMLLKELLAYKAANGASQKRANLGDEICSLRKSKLKHRKITKKYTGLSKYML